MCCTLFLPAVHFIYRRSVCLLSAADKQTPSAGGFTVRSGRLSLTDSWNENDGAWAHAVLHPVPSSGGALPAPTQIGNTSGAGRRWTLFPYCSLMVLRDVFFPFALWKLCPGATRDEWKWIKKCVRTPQRLSWSTCGWIVEVISSCCISSHLKASCLLRSLLSSLLCERLDEFVSSLSCSFSAVSVCVDPLWVYLTSWLSPFFLVSWLQLFCLLSTFLFVSS